MKAKVDSVIAPQGTPKRREQDLAMMRTPDNWPCWPRLPIKKSIHETGYLINTSLNDDTVEPKVYIGTIFQKHDESTAKVYTDLDAILDDGWTVD